MVHLPAVAILVLALGVSASCGRKSGPDADGDGLLDAWETSGLTNDPDGRGPLPAKFIDLPAMGADKNKADIFLQIDWMEEATHTHKLTDAAIRTVVDAFAASPYRNPNGTTGINVHVDEGPTSIMNFVTNTAWGSLSQAKQVAHVDTLGTNNILSGIFGYSWRAFDAIKNVNFKPTGRAPVFHYVISAHTYPSNPAGSSGISRDIPGSDLIISLGAFPGTVGTDGQQAGTLMHELGHNLGLRHGGGEDANYKPNYLSVMNYSFQLSGVIKNGRAGTFDYSRSKLGPLYERSLSEPAGIGTTDYGTRHWCSGVYQPVLDASSNTDWNCTVPDNEPSVTADINGEGGSQGTLNGYDDWANLKFKGGAIGRAGEAVELPETLPDTETMTPQEASKTLFTFEGFDPPVAHPPKINTASGGNVVPVKFRLGGEFGLDIFATGSPYSQQVDCQTGLAQGSTEPANNPGHANLKYTGKDGYTFNWETTTGWESSCRRLTLAFVDGSEKDALFYFQQVIR